MVVLHEDGLDPGVGAVALEEEAALIAVHARFDQLGAIKAGVDYLHGAESRPSR